LLADDDEAIRTVLAHALEQQGYNVRVTAQGRELLHWVRTAPADIVITDVIMPDCNGLELIPQIHASHPDLRIIAMSAQNTLSTAITAAQKGAYEYLPKPFDLEELLHIVERAVQQQTTSRGGQVDFQKIDPKLSILGHSPPMQNIYKAIARLVDTDITVLITGASGTGKELVAQALHRYSTNRSGAFVAINMAALPHELIESELFGHEKGAFTGAHNRHAGKFEQAENGTLFLDEIGDMPFAAQTRLLRILQEGEYTRVGGRELLKTNARIVAATHQNLPELVKAGKFREDLFYRLNVFPLHLPKLAERREDIPEMVAYFLAKNSKSNGNIPQIDKEALRLLQNYHWPGNVRELENFIKRLIVLGGDDAISGELVRQSFMMFDFTAQAYTTISQMQEKNIISKDVMSHNSEVDLCAREKMQSLSDSVRSHLRIFFQSHDGNIPGTGLYHRVLQEVERPLLELSLQATGGNQIKAAALLGINRNTLRKKMQACGLDTTKQFIR